MLLHKVKGPTSFTYLRTVNGVIHPTYQAACMALGLLENDQLWHDTLEEASLFKSSKSLRYLFAIMLHECCLSDPKELWVKYKEHLSEDLLHNARISSDNHDLQFTSDIFNKTLCLLEDIVINMGGRSLSAYNLPDPRREVDFEMHCSEKDDAENLLTYVADNECKLTAEQKIVYDSIMESSANNLGKLFFLDAPGGTGKTFLINLILAKIRSQGKIAIAVASSGIAATLLQGGRTAHSTFKLPINLSATDSPTCNISRNSLTAKLLLKCNLVVWDECTMSHKTALEAVSRTLQDLFNDVTKVMGPITFVFSGDFRQTLPVVPKGSRADEINACLKSSHVWDHVSVLKLSTNLRAQLYGDEGSEAFSKILLDIGNGELPITSNSSISIPQSLCTVVYSIDELVKRVYPDLLNLNYKPTSWWRERAILAPRNDAVRDINEYILKHFNSNEVIYTSIDTNIDENQLVDFPIEFLNSLDIPELPPHILKLKIGSIVILLRNIDPPRLCNGTRLKISQLKPNIIEGIIMTGCSEGDKVFIPRIPLIPSDSIYEFKRLQFPIRLSFAITINKSQGQTLSVVGVDLRNPCFSHGQLYVACSRVSSNRNLYVLLENDSLSTKNIVYQEALRSVCRS
jgi:hypothetical protein